MRKCFAGDCWARLVLAGLALMLTACGSLVGLRDDMREAGASFTRVSGKVMSRHCPDCPAIVVALGDRSGKPLVTYRVLENSGEFDIVTIDGSRYLFAFNDLNGDFEYQPDEPAGWYELPPGQPGGARLRNVQIDIEQPVPENSEWPKMGNLFDQQSHLLGSLDMQVGTVISLDDPRFDHDMAGMGMWRPLHFMRTGYAGIYFLEAYDPRKIPVLFVHGVAGTPRDFAPLISHLDRQRYQPWVFYYPTALDIRAAREGLSGILSMLNHRYRFDELHLVAHSVGGLVTRSYLGSCRQSGSCDYIRSFTSISSPFDGDTAAQSGVDYSPVVMPIWNNLAPGSNFLRRLFRNPLPEGVGHHLLFGFRNTSLVLTRSGDETVPLTSQLRPEAQMQASAIRGFDEDHMSILGSDAVAAYVSGVFARASRK